MTEVSLNHVGMALGLELSRFSRSSQDWYQLVEVCGIFQTLFGRSGWRLRPAGQQRPPPVGDAGAMNEYELVSLRNRLLRGCRNKAEHGELFLAVPLGYLKTSTGEIVQDPDLRDILSLLSHGFRCGSPSPCREIRRSFLATMSLASERSRPRKSASARRSR